MLIFRLLISGLFLLVGSSSVSAALVTHDENVDGDLFGDSFQIDTPGTNSWSGVGRSVVDRINGTPLTSDVDWVIFEVTQRSWSIASRLTPL